MLMTYSEVGHTIDHILSPTSWAGVVFDNERMIQTIVKIRFRKNYEKSQFWKENKHLYHSDDLS